MLFRKAGGQHQVHTAAEVRQIDESHLAALYEASQVFLEQLDAQAVLESTCRLAVDRFGLQVAWVGLVKEGSFDVHPAFVYGDGTGFLASVHVTWDDSAAGQGPTGIALRTGRAATANRIESDPILAYQQRRALVQKHRSSASLPLLAGEQVLGALNVYSLEPDHFTPQQIHVLQSLANQAALAFYSARLHEQARSHNDELRFLHRVIAACAVSGRDPEALLEAVCCELAGAFRLPQVTAALLDESCTQATVVAEYRAAGQVGAVGSRFPVADNPSFQYVIERKAPLVMDDARTDPRLGHLHEHVQACGIVSLLLLPLSVQEQILGVLSLSATEPRPFSAEEVDLARRVADHVSGVLAHTHLRQTQQRLGIAVEQAAESIVITDAQGTILYSNPAFERVSGCEHLGAVGQNLYALRGDEQDAAALRDYWESLGDAEVWRGRFVSKGGNGNSYIEEATITPVRNPAGEVVNYIAILRDATREAQLEEQLHRAQKMEAVGRLAGGIAHDFNNILTIIHLTGRLLERGLEREHPMWQHVQRIQEAGDRATELVRQLLTFSRRETVQPLALDLNKVIDHLSQMLQRIIGEDIQLRIELAEGLWGVTADPSRLEQVIMNLAVNARDAMPRGGILAIKTDNVVLDSGYASLHIDAQPGDYVMLTLSDTGTGMDDEVKSHIFEPFFTTKERGKGTGLGLATVFGIVKQSQGHIQVYSEVGYGTTFRIYLPRADCAGQNVQASALDVEPQSLNLEQRGVETILLVEDETAVRNLADQILTSLGYRVLSAKDGGEALQISAEYTGPIHLLLTDVVMPMLSGQELAEMLRRQRPGIRVLYTSGFASEAIESHGILEKDAVFLSKPLTLTSLIQGVRAALDKTT
jgi:PAS domain S-box-containing protein